MSTLNVMLDSPLSLYSIPVMWFSTFFPHTLKYLAIDKLVGYNNTLPRSSDAKSTTGKLPPKTTLRLARMEGAHQNGNEAFPLFAAAIIVGNYARLDNRYLNTMALTYVGLRLAYNVTYIYFNDVGKGWVRSGLFFYSLSYPLRILIKAAGAVANQKM